MHMLEFQWCEKKSYDACNRARLYYVVLEYSSKFQYTKYENQHPSLYVYLI